MRAVMISKHDVQRWVDFVDAQMAEFDRGIVAATGKPYAPDAVSVAFLQVDDSLLKQKIEQAVDRFIKRQVGHLSMNISS
jgi:hypothetical protein